MPSPTQIAQQYLPLLASVVREYCRRFPLADPDDVYQDGAVGLMQAALRCQDTGLVGEYGRRRILGAIIDARKENRAARHGLKVHTSCHESILDRPVRHSCEEEVDVWWAEQLESCTDLDAMLLESKYRFGCDDKQTSQLTGVPRRLVKKHREAALSRIRNRSTSKG